METLLKFILVSSFAGIFLIVVYDFWACRKEWYWGSGNDDKEKGKDD